jgi:hypothetical protein
MEDVFFVTLKSFGIRRPLSTHEIIPKPRQIYKGNKVIKRKRKRRIKKSPDAFIWLTFSPRFGQFLTLREDGPSVMVSKVEPEVYFTKVFAQKQP